MTRFQLKLPVESQTVTKNRTDHKMHVEGPQICQISRWNNSFQNMYGMYRQQLTVWPEKSILCQKNTSFSPILVDKNLSYLTLEGPGRQTVDTRSISWVALKTLGYNASNQLCGRSVAPKLSAHEPATLFQCVCTEIRKKVIFLGKTLHAQIFFGSTTHRILTHS